MQPPSSGDFKNNFGLSAFYNNSIFLPTKVTLKGERKLLAVNARRSGISGKTTAELLESSQWMIH